MKLYHQVKKNYNSSNIVVVDNVMENLVESFYNIVLIKGNDFISLLEYLKASEY